jgi:excisionase family DNA binding protein
MPEKRLMDVKEAAEFLNLSPRTLYKKTCARQIPFLKLGGKLLFDRRELDEYIDAHRVAAI